jgi:hypothetical protein
MRTRRGAYRDTTSVPHEKRVELKWSILRFNTKDAFRSRLEGSLSLARQGTLAQKRNEEVNPQKKPSHQSRSVLEEFRKRLRNGICKERGTNVMDSVHAITSLALTESGCHPYHKPKEIFNLILFLVLVKLDRSMELN